MAGKALRPPGRGRRSGRTTPAARAGILAPSPGCANRTLLIIIVSGMPRSGTSLMMQMLAAAGIPILSDDVRPADDSSPRGYYEWAPIKQLSRSPSILAKAEGKAVKIVSPLLL